MSTKQKDYLTSIKENVNRLELNKPYKFTELCRILCLEVPKSKNSKAALLKALDSIVERIEENKKHIILSIREQQVEIIDNRGRSEGSRNNYTGVYGDNLLNTMLYMCVTMADRNKLYKDNGDDFVLTASRHDIMCEIGIRNRHNYYVAKTQPNNFCYQLDVNRSVFDYVSNRISTNSYNAVKNVLDNIIKIGLAIKTDTMKVLSYHRNEDGTFDKNIITDSRFATEEEFIEISHIKRSVATEMGYKNESQVHSTYNSDKKAEFYKRVNELTYEKFGISEHYPMIKLHMKKSNIDQYLQKFDNITLDELITIGNESFINQQKRTIKSNRTKYINGKGATTNSKAYVQGLDDYLDQSDDIVKHLVGLFADRLELLQEDLKVNHVTGEYENENEYENYKYENYKYENEKIPMLLKVIAEKYGVEQNY